MAVVEDNPDNRILVRAILEEFYDVVDYEDGRSAILGITTTPPDLILMDISLPEMDGVEILCKLREDQELKKIPAIALTAFAMEGDRERFLNAGFEEYIAKPIDEDLLLKAIRMLLGEEH
ncbi:hypothetical protein BVY04_04385 [bacterium M21]|nr:hypothetical protein BVY04_04385 [bacterium M21]